MNNGNILQGQNRMRAKLLSTIIVMTGLIFGILLFSPNILSLNHSASTMAQIDDSIGSSPFSLSNLIEQGSPYLGNRTAPITIIDFSDFQCHLCARHLKNTEPIINETYIQTGKIALVFKHLPNRGFDSMGADNLKMFASQIPELEVKQFT